MSSDEHLQNGLSSDLQDQSSDADESRTAKKGGTLAGQFEEGKLVANRYRLDSLLGAGGMGKVYLAEDTKLSRKIVIKTILPSEDHKKEDRKKKRFFREAKSMAQMIHPNIATLFDFGFDESFQSYFMAIEYIEGETFKSYLRKKGGQLNYEDFLSIYSQVLFGLDAAHQKNIIHRDLKLDNLMITKRGQVKILDFGLAKNTSSQSLTSDSEILGSVKYMSPEQITGDHQDERSDIYALGVIAFILLSGEFPFDADGDIPYLYTSLQSEPKKFSSVIKDTACPKELLENLDSCLQKDPLDRPQTVKTMMSFFPELSTNFSRLTIEQNPLDLKAIQPEKSRSAPWLLPITAVAFLALGVFFGALFVYETGLKTLQEELIVKNYLLIPSPSEALKRIDQHEKTHSSEDLSHFAKERHALKLLKELMAETSAYVQKKAPTLQEWQNQIQDWEERLLAIKELWPEAPQLTTVSQSLPSYISFKNKTTEQTAELSLTIGEKKYTAKGLPLLLSDESQVTLKMRLNSEATTGAGIKRYELVQEFHVKPGSLVALSADEVLVESKLNKQTSSSAKRKSQKSSKTLSTPKTKVDKKKPSQPAIPLLSID